MATISICSLASGSSGNATYVATDQAAILVDCGTTAREAVARLAAIGVDPASLDGILITHAHVDHYRSAGTLHARYGIPVYVDPTVARALEWRGRSTSWNRVKETCPLPEVIGDIEVETLDTSHGDGPKSGRTAAFLLHHRRRKVGVVTDLGKVDAAMIASLRGFDAVVLEANYDEATIRRKLDDPSFASDWTYLSWVEGDKGHLSNRQCAETLLQIVEKPSAHVFLGHVSENHHSVRHDNNHHRVAMETVRNAFSRAGLTCPNLHRTHRIGLEAGRPTPLIEIS